MQCRRRRIDQENERYRARAREAAQQCARLVKWEFHDDQGKSQEASEKELKRQAQR